MAHLGVCKGTFRYEHVGLHGLQRLTRGVVLHLIVAGVEVPDTAINHKNLSRAQDVPGRKKGHLYPTDPKRLVKRNRPKRIGMLTFKPMGHESNGSSGSVYLPVAGRRVVAMGMGHQRCLDRQFRVDKKITVPAIVSPFGPARQEIRQYFSVAHRFLNCRSSSNTCGMSARTPSFQTTKSALAICSS